MDSLEVQRTSFLVMSHDRALQLLHSAFKLDKWMYASASCIGVDHYWIKIPLKTLLNPMDRLNYDMWRNMGSPVIGKEIPNVQDQFCKPRSNNGSTGSPSQEIKLAIVSHPHLRSHVQLFHQV